MKRFLLYFIVIVFILSCKQDFKKCEFIHTNIEMAVYNDVLIELTEQHFYYRFLGKAGNTIMTEYRDPSIDSLQLANHIREAQNKLFGDTIRFRTIYLCDTINQRFDFNNTKISANITTIAFDKLSKEFSTNKDYILDIINQPMLNYKAESFHSCTFNIKSIREFKLSDLDSEIGIINFSKIVFNKHKNEAILVCNYYCGGFGGKGYFLHVKNINNHWKIIDFHRTWVS